MDDLENGQLTAEGESTELQVEEEVVEQKEDKRPSSVVKLLKQRNEERAARKELEAKLSNSSALEKKVAELEEQFARQTLEQESKVEKSEFFGNNPQAKEYEAEIEKLRETKDLTYDEAFKLYAANTNPALLMDEQFRNKATATNPLTGVVNEAKVDIDNPESMNDFKTPEEFYEWSERMARNSRKESGYTN
jgi:hypothetical protein